MPTEREIDARLYPMAKQRRAGTFTPAALTPDGAAHTRTMSGMSGPDPGEWPEPSPVKTELLPVEPLPLSIIPLPFRSWIKDVSDRMQCPPDFVAAAMLVMTGSIIGTRCGIRPKKADDWTVIPNLWGGVIGRPSMMKMPAMAEGIKPMDALTTVAKQDFEAVFMSHLAEMEVFKAQREAIKGKMLQAAKTQQGAKDKAVIKDEKAETPTKDETDEKTSMQTLKADFASLEEPKPAV